MLKNLKTIVFLSTLAVVGFMIASFFAGNILLSQVIMPFSSLNPEITKTSDPDSTTVTFNDDDDNSSVVFVDRALLTGWMPWAIKQISILIGGISLVVFLYAGISLILHADNEEQLGKATKMFGFAVVGIALAALSYTLVANLLNLF